MNKLTKDKRVQVLTALVEGNSIRAAVRMTGVAKNTIVKLLADAGRAALEFNEHNMVNLKLKRIQCDEIWSFVGMKEKNVPAERKGQGVADVWTWTAIDIETKLVPCWLIGSRDAECAKEFISELASRLAHRVQLSTDGRKAYLSAVEDAFYGEVDYSMLVNIYGDAGESAPEVRYSSGDCCAMDKDRVCGLPDSKHVSTSSIERQHLTKRTSMRRFTRLTNAFSKKAENLAHAVAFHCFNYNFCRKHLALGITPAMAAGITPKPATLGDLVDLLDSN